MKKKDFNELVAVSGLPHLHRMLANRPNGLIVEDITNGKRTFAPARKHQFTPLASIGIYKEDGDTVELQKVFQNIRLLESEGITDLPDPSSADDLRAFFEKVLPGYDREEVSLSDMRKVVKWYGLIKAYDYFPSEDEEEE